MEALTDIAQQWYISSDCPFVRATFLDIVSLCGMAMLLRSGSSPLIGAWEKLTSSVSLGPQHAIGARKRTGDALLKKSLAQAFVVDRVILRGDSLSRMTSKGYQNIGDALYHLAGKDKDTCCAALDTLDKVLKLQPSSDLLIPLDLVLSQIHMVLLQATDAEVISRAQPVLANGLVYQYLRVDFFNFVTEKQIFSTLAKLEQQCLEGPPSNMQSALHLIGFFLDFAYNFYPAQRHNVLHALSRYVRLLRMTIVDTNPFDTRFAAVQSLSALHHIWTTKATSKATSPLLLALCFILYDLLNDDDDDIRSLAAHATSNLLRAQGNPKLSDSVPLLTTHRLAKFLSKTFNTSNDLYTEAMRRLTATPSPTRLFTTPVADHLEDARLEDTSLFAREKQNLYFDPVLDAVYWSRILLALPPLKSATEFHIHDLARHFVRPGIFAFTQTARSEVDDALGWTSKPEVFALGMRVFCASEVVVKWGTVQERRDVVRGLGVFREVGERGGVHGLWMEKVGRVLEREVLRMIGGVAESLRGL